MCNYQVPLIVGNKDEGTFFSELFSLADTFNEGFGEEIAMSLVDSMGEARNIPTYIETVVLQNPDKDERIEQIWTDFFHSAVATASRRAERRNTDVWVYRFDLPPRRILSALSSSWLVLVMILAPRMLRRLNLLSIILICLTIETFFMKKTMRLRRS